MCVGSVCVECVSVRVCVCVECVCVLSVCVRVWSVCACVTVWSVCVRCRACTAILTRKAKTHPGRRTGTLLPVYSQQNLPETSRFSAVISSLQPHGLFLKDPF